MIISRSTPWTLWKIAAIFFALIAPFLMYFDTALSMVAVWNSSETFAHGYIILPISLWLIWQRRDSLAQMQPTPFWPGLLLVAACGFGWMLAELADVQVVRQYAFVAFLPLTVLVVAGWRTAWSLAFPLCFLLLAVPFGEIFIDSLINFTADFTVAALQMTGIPVLREGTHFTIPSGNWSVVTACSGVRYLISSVTLGLLYAYLTYRSRLRQAMFVLLSIIVPIIANGLRAYMIVMIGHLSGMKLAVGFDHLIYGWLFFGLVMFLMFWIGSFWREDHQLPLASKDDIPQQNTAGHTSLTNVAGAALCCMVFVGMWPLYARYIEGAAFNPAPVNLTLQSSLPDTDAFTAWTPYFPVPSAEFIHFYQGEKKPVGVLLKYYRNQQRGASLISSSNQLLAEKEAMWRNVGSTHQIEMIGNLPLHVREGRLQNGKVSMVVWYWYWIDGRFTANDYLGKLLRAKEELFMHGDDGAAVMVFAPYNDSPEEARVALRSFLQGHLTALQTTLSSNIKQ